MARHRIGDALGRAGWHAHFENRRLVRSWVMSRSVHFQLPSVVDALLLAGAGFLDRDASDCIIDPYTLIEH